MKSNALGSMCVAFLWMACGKVGFEPDPVDARASGDTKVIDGFTGTGGTMSTGGKAGTGSSAGSVATGGTMRTGGTSSSSGSVGIGLDAGADNSLVQKDAALEGAGQDGSVDGGGPIACKGSLALSSLLPMTAISETPESIALGDVNGDGKLDIATARGVLLARGDGTFATQIDYAADYYAGQVALGDLNGDGKLDVVVPGSPASAGNRMNVLFGKGDGSFAAGPAFATGSIPSALVPGDLNGDGKLDITTANYSASTVSVLLGKGDGTFAASKDCATGVGPSALALGDLNSDGKLDLAVVSAGSMTASSISVSVLLGNGNGTFAAKSDLPIRDDWGQENTSSLALGDLNRDGKLDIIATIPNRVKSSQDTIDVLLGFGDGTFAPPSSLATGTWPVLLPPIDLDHDGKLDLVVELPDGMMSILLGQGDGTFAAKVDYRAGGILKASALGDLNGDGNPDLALAFAGRGNPAENKVGVLFGKSDGSFVTFSSYPTGGTPQAIASGDFNGDGKLDIATANAEAGTVSVLLGNGGGSFAAGTDYATGDQPAALVLGDLDGDSRLDIVTANSAADTVSVLFGVGHGTFAAKVDYPTASWPTSVALRDVNGDGNLDIVTSNGKSYTGKGAVNVLLGTGGGKFAAHVDYQAGPGPTSLALGDVDRDGRVDIVVVNAEFDGYETIGVLPGIGGGKFAAMSVVATVGNGTQTSVMLGDLNGDGKLDIVMAGDSQCRVYVLLGKGDGTFAAKVEYATWDYTHALALGDLNGDGKLDIVVASTGTTEVLLGKGDGTFAPMISYAVSSSTLALGDFDGDGRLDVATAAYASAVSVLLGACH